METEILFHIRRFAHRTIDALATRLKYYGCMFFINTDGAIVKVWQCVFEKLIHDIVLFGLRLSVKFFGAGPLLCYVKFQFKVSNLRLKFLIFLLKHANESLNLMNSWEVGDVS